MRLCILTIGLSMLVTLGGLAEEALSQQVVTPGFRLFQDGNGRVVAAEYYGAARLQFHLSRLPQRQEFPPLARLHEFPDLKSMVFPYGTTLTVEDIDHLSKLTNVVELELGCPGVNSEYVTMEGDLLKLGRLKSLEVLRLCKEAMKDEDLEFIASLPKITYLEFNADTSDFGEQGPTATDRCAAYLSRASTLRSICVMDGRQFTDTFISTVTAGLPELEQLELSSPELTDESLRLLAERCKKLTWLDLHSNRFTDEGVKHLANLNELEILGLYSPSLTADCVKYVADLQRLRHLSLTVPSIEDEGVHVLANLRQLEILALRQPALTDRQFAMFRNHPTLESAFINGSRLSEQEVVGVMKTLPKLKHLEVGSNRDLQNAVHRAFTVRQSSQ